MNWKHSANAMQMQRECDANAVRMQSAKETQREQTLSECKANAAWTLGKRRTIKLQTQREKTLS